jgi:hypothetical protein
MMTYHKVQPEVLTAVIKNMAVCCVLALCSLLDIYQGFSEVLTSFIIRATMKVLMLEELRISERWLSSTRPHSDMTHKTAILIY